MIKADLHVHSYWSDCNFTMEECIISAKENNVTHISFTDHDCTDGLNEALELGKKYKIKIIPGIELSCRDYDTGKKVHILGYDFKDTYAINKVCEGINKERNNNAEIQIKALQKLGYDIDFEKIGRGKKTVFKQYVLDYLVEKGYQENIFGDMYYKYFKNNGPCDTKVQYIDVIKAVKAIRESGGYPVLAHPGQQNNFESLEKLCKAGLLGIELIHPSADEKIKERIIKLSKEYNLFVTGGSDFHGKFDRVKNNKIGDYSIDSLEWRK